jgi:ubiquinone/menaquinone biosynthesis C-methylase UbiE
MHLNAIETALMHNPIRALLQRHYELPLLVQLGGAVAGLRVLEIGCGGGVATAELLRRHRVASVHAFDLDAAFVSRARRRLAGYAPNRVQLSVADATAIPACDQSFDAVFDFGVLHHVPAWRDAVAEVRRVLRPGGRFFFEEVTRQALDRPVYRTFLRHPREDRFSGEELVRELEGQGIVVNDVRFRVFGDFVIGVGRHGR